MHRVFFYVQHLKGLGHVVRAQRIVAALVADGFAVTVAFGGLPVAALTFPGADVRQLPAISTAEGSFSALVDAEGVAVDDAFKLRRRDALLAMFDDVAPSLLVTEMFPLGRRNLRFELLPLLERARSRPERPWIVASVRDILQTPKDDARVRQQVNWLTRYYDALLVHGDRDFAPLEASYPAASGFAHMIRYTGLVGPDLAQGAAAGMPPAPADVVVSVGGGAVGHDILRVAMRAKPLSQLAGARWLALTGPNASPAVRAELEALGAEHGVTLEVYRANLCETMRRARLSIQLGGYNTVADLLAAGCAGVVIPFVEGGETEQHQRATRLVALGRAAMVEPEGLDAVAMATAIDRALALPRSGLAMQLDGAHATARILAELTARQTHPLA